MSGRAKRASLTQDGTPHGCLARTRTSLGAPPTPRFGLAKLKLQTPGADMRRGNEEVCVLEIVRPGMEDSESAEKQENTGTVCIVCPGCDAARAPAKRCIADPGPPQTETVPGLQRTTSCCAAPGIRERGAFWRNEPNDHFAIRGRRAKDQPAAVRNGGRRNFHCFRLILTMEIATPTRSASEAHITPICHPRCGTIRLCHHPSS